MAEKNQPFGLLSLKDQRVKFLALLIVADISEEHRITFPVRGVLDTLDDQREERIRDIRHSSPAICPTGACASSGPRAFGE